MKSLIIQEIVDIIKVLSLHIVIALNVAAIHPLAVGNFQFGNDGQANKQPLYDRSLIYCFSLQHTSPSEKISENQISHPQQCVSSFPVSRSSYGQKSLTVSFRYELRSSTVAPLLYLHNKGWVALSCSEGWGKWWSSIHVEECALSRSRHFSSGGHKPARERQRIESHNISL